jgi:hypothetical protein
MTGTDSVTLARIYDEVTTDDLREAMGFPFSPTRPTESGANGEHERRVGGTKS